MAVPTKLSDPHGLDSWSPYPGSGVYVGHQPSWPSDYWGDFYDWLFGPCPGQQDLHPIGQGAFGWNGYTNHAMNPASRSDEAITNANATATAIAASVTVGVTLAAAGPLPASNAAAALGETAGAQVTIGWVYNGQVVISSGITNTSHLALGTQAGVVVNGEAVAGAEAFTAIVENGQLTVVGSVNFGSLLGISSNAIDAVARFLGF